MAQEDSGGASGGGSGGDGVEYAGTLTLESGSSLYNYSTLTNYDGELEGNNGGYLKNDGTLDNEELQYAELRRGQLRRGRLQRDRHSGLRGRH